jgi:hypothetical protein
MECKGRHRVADCDGKPLEEDTERKRRRGLDRSESSISSGAGPQHENLRAVRYDVDALKKSMSNVEKLLVAIASQLPSAGLAQLGAAGVQGYAFYLSSDL